MASATDAEVKAGDGLKNRLTGSIKLVIELASGLHCPASEDVHAQVESVKVSSRNEHVIYASSATQLTEITQVPRLIHSLTREASRVR